MAQVLLIDDDEIERLGRGVVLEQLGHDVVSTRWSAVGDPGLPLDQIEVVLLAMRPDRHSWDRFSYLSKMALLRPHLGGRARVAAMAWGRAVANPMLGTRFATAGILEVLDPAQVAGRVALREVIEGRVRGSDPRPTARELAYWRVGPGSDPEAVLAWIMNRAEIQPAYLHAFAPGCTQNQSGLSRRQTFAVRAKVAEYGQVRLDGRLSSGGPLRNQTSPRWSDVVQFVNMCRGAEEGVGDAISPLILEALPQ